MDTRADTSNLRVDLVKTLDALKQVQHRLDKGRSLDRTNLFNGLAEKIYGKDRGALKEKETVVKKEVMRRLDKGKAQGLKKLDIGL